MTPERAKELLPVIQAYAEGKKIQFAYKVNLSKWYDIEQPTWDPTGGCVYRIKPEKKVGWVNIYKSPLEGGSSFLVSGGPYKTKEDAKRYQGRNCVACILIEFEEGEGL